MPFSPTPRPFSPSVAATLVSLSIVVLPLLGFSGALAQDPVGCMAATEAESANRFEDAVQAYLACSYAGEPGERAWALSRAARVLAVKLFRFDEALALLQRIQLEHPTDPRAIAAAGLSAEIRDGRAAGDEPLRLYYSVRERPDLIPPGRSIDDLRRVMTEFPSFAFNDWIMRTLAVELRNDGDVEGALTVLGRMRERFAGTPAAATAVLETGATYFSAGRFTEAATWFRRLPEFGGSASVGEANAQRALKHRSRQTIERVALAWSSAWLGWVALATRWRRVGSGLLAHALREFWVIGPIWALLVLVTFRISPNLRSPIWWMGVVTLVVVTLSNLCVLTRALSPRLALAHAAATTVTIAALVYVLLYSYDLVFTLEETLRLGSG